jgi:dihydrofolate reductase
MQQLWYGINITLDGCCDHRAAATDPELHAYWTEKVAAVDGMVLGRVTYEMMEAAWREPARTGEKPEWMLPWMMPFARVIDGVKKYVVSSTLERVDWNGELLRGDLREAVEQLKRAPGRGLSVGGVKLATALAGLGVIDGCEFVVHPRVAGHGPRVLEGMMRGVELRLVGRREFGSGAVAMRYEVRR